MIGPARRDHRATAARAEPSPGGVPINVIDVAPGVPAAQIVGLIQLGPGERVTAVNDRVAASDLEAGALIASLPRHGEYLDLSVASPVRERRVLVLLH
jgi:S1-C subfamily serine protease